MRRKIPALREAFTGHFDDHHRFLLEQMLGRIDGLVNTESKKRSHIRQLESLGYRVTIEPAA